MNALGVKWLNNNEEFSYEIRSRKAMHCIFPAFLCFCIILTLPGISDMFPVVAAGQEESIKTDDIIMDFYSLSAGVKAQTLLVQISMS